MNNKALNASLNKLAKFALSHTEIVKNTSRMMTYNDEPKVFTYISDYESDDKSRPNSSSGTSFDKKRALVKVLGEATERYCLETIDKKDFITASISELLASRASYMDPFKIPSFSKNQLSKKCLENLSFQRTQNSGGCKDTLTHGR